MQGGSALNIMGITVSAGFSFSGAGPNTIVFLGLTRYDT